MSGDVTYQALKRLSYLPERDSQDNGTVIAGQEYDDVYFLGGFMDGVTIGDQDPRDATFFRVDVTNLFASGYVSLGLTPSSFVTTDSDGGTTTTTSVVVTVKKQVFTSSGTYTPSTGLQYAIVEAVGSGGGGGGAQSAVGTSAAAGGGGSGAYARRILTAAQIGASQAVTIGAAGAGASAGTGSGTNGSNCSLGTLVVAAGGLGASGAGSGSSGFGGNAGTTGTGDLIVAGQDGDWGQAGTIITIAAISGFGGGSFFGGIIRGSAAQAGSTTNTAGNAGRNYGSGGAGGVSMNSTTGAAGGNGSTGIIIITEFCNQ